MFLEFIPVSIHEYILLLLLFPAFATCVGTNFLFSYSHDHLDSRRELSLYFILNLLLSLSPHYTPATNNSQVSSFHYHPSFKIEFTRQVRRK